MSFVYRLRTQITNGCLGLLLLTVCSSFAAVDQLKIIVENDLKKPGNAQVYFPHLQQWLPADGLGVIRLPQPYGELEVITVAPRLREIYGPSFKRIFPIRDGIVSLRAIPVTAGIKAKAVEFIRVNKPAEAATAFALTAKREEGTDQSEAMRNQQMAYDALAKKYGVTVAYIREGNTLRASPQLVAAINRKLGRTAVSADGRFTVDDFRKAAEMKSYSPIIAATQEKFFATH